MQHQDASTSYSQSLQLSKLATNVLHVILYFDIFDYPLTKEEIFNRSTLSNQSEVNKGLQELQDSKILFYIQGYYSLHNEIWQINKRLAGNKSAEKHLKLACRMTSYMKYFPFVRGVMLSGSISKNYMDKSSDIDYFIITAPNRLWICRLFFVLFQKLILFNRYKYFCYNYMIDENHLAISDKSFYTAIEASTLLPVYNYSLYQQFRKSNLWTQVYFPNFPLEERSLLSDKQTFLQKASELLFNNKFADWLDKWLMKKTEAKWHKRHVAEMFGVKNLELKRYTAKAHTEGHYNRIMSLFNEKQQAFEKKYNITFEQPKNILTSLKLNA
jgi:hypothetical protein